MTIRAIVFDKDGTLLDFQATYGPATRDMLETIGDARMLADAIAFDVETLRFAPHSPVIAGTNADIHRAFTEAGVRISLEDLDRLFTQAALPHATLLPGVEAVLRILDQPLGIATNDAAVAARRQFAKLGIDDLFEVIVGYDSGHGSKPEPGMVSACAEQMGRAASETMFVGDSLTDCRAGRAAGAVMVAMTTGEATANELAPYADHVLSSLSDLPGLLDRI